MPRVDYSLGMRQHEMDGISVIVLTIAVTILILGIAGAASEADSGLTPAVHIEIYGDPRPDL